MKEPGKAWIVMLLASCVLLGCGDDGGGSDGASDGDGHAMGTDACLQAGMTMTGCTCDNGGTGSRSCQEDLTWSVCVCRTPLMANECMFEGQRVDCNNTCLGEDGPHTVTCNADMTFDCSCPARPGMPGGGGDGDSDGGI